MLTDAHRILLKERSLLGLVFEGRPFDDVFASLEILSANAGTVVTQQGHASIDCVIPLEGEIELFTSASGETVMNGTVQAGRTVNTYALLRQQPYQYSARFRKAGTYVRVPSTVITQALASNARLKTYLLGMTESFELRVVSKEIDSLGCKNAFKVHLISCLEARNCRPQEWIMSPNEIPHETFFLIEGNVVSQRLKAGGAQSALQLQIPARTWVAWRQLHDRSETQNIIKAVSNAKLLVLSRADFDELSKLYPDDFELYSQSILSGQNRDAEDDEREEDLDIDELVKRTTKRRYFWQGLPWVQQNDQMDCGPACLAMISNYYEHKVSIQFWRNQLSTGREGTSLFDLAKTSERCGFTSYALSAEDLTSFDSGFFPAIALRRYHYLVVYKVTAKHVIVGDPARGIVRMPIAEFNDGFDQVMLFLRPTENFYDLPEGESHYAHFWQMLRGLEREIGLNFIVSVMIVALGLITPILSQIFMDDILVKRDMQLLKISLAASALVAVLSGFLGWTRNYYANFLAAKFNFRAHSVFIKKMLSLNYRFFADRHVGDFTRRLGEMEKIKRFMLQSVEEIVLSVLSLTIYTIALFFYAPRIAVAVFAATPFFFLLSWISGRKLTTLYQDIFKESSEIESGVTDIVKGVASIKALGAELASRWRYEEKLVKLLKAERKFSLSASSIGVFAGFYQQFVNALIMGLAAYMAIDGSLSPGQVVAVTMIAGSVLSPLTALAGKFGEIQEIRSVFNRLNDVLLAPSEKVSNQGRVRKARLRGDIEFKDVWFRYGGEGSDWTLKGVSFKIEAGSNVAFVGPSGSGKSTVATLITRMYEPTKGQIFIDDRDYLDYDVEWLRGQIGMLHQESHLFQGSISENIAFSEPEIDVGKVQKAATQAAAHDFIQKKTGDYGYVLSPGGLGLSGGEKQRIALARTFYREPKMLILDEATSALDGIAEAKLLNNIKSATQNLTIINIAHRLSTVKYSDYALVLFEGKVVGFGTHDQLHAENEIYQRLFSPQFGRTLTVVPDPAASEAEEAS